MTYHQFLTYVREQSVYELEHPEDYQITINHVVKNNSVELDGICLHKHGESLSPTIYLNSYYEEYQKGRPLKSILGEIISTISNDIPRLEIPASLYDDYDSVRQQIILRLVNYKRNQEQLKTCPYLPFCDLAITFRWLVHSDPYGIASSLITNRELDLWNITVEELYQTAIVNTRNLFPARIQPLQELLTEYQEENKAFQQFMDSPLPSIPLYLLSNQNRINGATCMIYEHVLADFAAEQNSDIYILPSSIHEVLMIPARFPLEEEALLSMVYNANRTVVSLTEILSDSIYRYDRFRNRITLIEQWQDP